MRYKAAICDDNAADRTYIQDLAGKWADARGHSLHLSAFSSAESFLFCYDEESDFDILLLDIEMDGMDGVSLAKKLRESNETVQIIFITGYSDYIAEGYEVAALHYLMKPVKEDKLFSVLDRAADKLRTNERVLLLETGGEMIRIPLYQIRYIDVHQNYATIHAREDITVKRTLGELSGELDDRFFRAGRSAIVNLTCIARVSKTELHLTDGTLIPLPRGAADKVARALINMK